MVGSRWPEPADEAGWAAVVAAGELGQCPPGEIVAALRALFLSGDVRLVRALTAHVSDRVTRRLRRLIGTHHANDGRDIVERAHGALMTAVFDPASDDGQDLVDAFWPRVRYRGIDAARAEVKFTHRHPLFAVGDDGEVLVPAHRRMDGGAGSVEVSQHLSLIRDPRKRLALRLHIEGVRIGRGNPCIATVCGCDPKTAARWIAEARAILAARLELGA